MAQNNPILVVGAGPTGLMLATELFRRGVPCRIIDKSPSATDKSKALAVHSRTLELFENKGLVDRALERGNRCYGFTVADRETRLLHLSFDELVAPYPFVLMIPQSETEKLLTEHLQELGGKIERPIELVSFSDDGTNVKATLRHENGKEEIVETPWLIGCDGAHSTVRKGAGVKFQGEQYEQHFGLVDVAINSPAVSHDELITFVSDEGACVYFPFGKNRFRVVAEFSKEKVDAADPRLEDFQEMVEKRCVPGIRLEDPQWIAWFKISRRLAEKYRIGRVFICGDAAHIHSPVGGQGMNTGLQDAFNLAWKIALVYKGQAPNSLLDSFNDERHPLAEMLLEGTDAATKVATFRHPVAMKLRNHLMPLLTDLEVIQQRILRAGSMLAINYRHSPIVGESRDRSKARLVPGQSEAPGFADWFEFGRGPLPGDRAPDAMVIDPQTTGAKRLFEIMQNPQFNLLLLDGKPTAAGYETFKSIAKAVNERYGANVQVHAIIAADKVPAELNNVTGLKLWLDPDLAFHQQYCAGSECLFLIRPDWYVGFRSQPAELEPLMEHLSKILSPVSAGVGV